MLQQCRFFASSKGCKYGDKCKFSHSNSQSIPICKSYLSGKCRYGDKCKFAHSKSLPTDQKHAQSKKICRLYQQNACRYGSKCKFLHSKSLRTIKKKFHNPFNKESMTNNQTSENKDTQPLNKRIARQSKKKRVCKLHLANKCRYGSKCKFKHSPGEDNNENNIELKNLNLCLKYNGIVQTKDYMRSNTLYFYYSSEILQGTTFTFNKIEIDDQIREYHTDIVIQQNDKLSEYSCALIEGNHLFVHQNNTIYKCMKVNTLFIDNTLIYKYKTVHQIQLKNYENNIALISDNYDETCVYYTVHDMCICNDDRGYIMLFTLYVSVTNLIKITDIQIFDVSGNKIECAYHMNKYNALSMGYSEKKLSLGQFYWFNKRALFYEEYDSVTGLGQLCVGWDSMDLCKSNREILSMHLNGINYLVNIVFQFVSTFNFIDKKRIIFHNISNIKIDRRNGILYVNCFSKSGMKRNSMHSYKIMS